MPSWSSWRYWDSWNEWWGGFQSEWGDSSWAGEGEGGLPSSHEWHSLSGDQTVEAEASNEDDIMDWYHGTTVFAIPQTMEVGLLPSFGAGAGAMA